MESKKEKNIFEKKCYEAYKLHWMITHACTLKEMLHEINDIATEIVEEDAMSAATDGSSMETLMRKAEDTFLMDVGFDGSLWACFDEFLQTEFADPAYMEGLISMMDDHEKMWKFYCEHYHSNNDTKNKEEASATLLSKEDTQEFIGQIIDIFEDFLEEKGVQLNFEESDDEAVLYGNDYDSLSDKIKNMLKAWHVIKE